MRKPRSPISPIEALRKLARSGLQNSPHPNRHIEEVDPLATLESRIASLLGIATKPSRPATGMIFFIAVR